MLGGGEDYKEYDKKVQSMPLMRDFGFVATSSWGPDGVRGKCSHTNNGGEKGGA